MSWSISWTSCKRHFYTSKFAYLKSTRAFLKGCGSSTNFLNGGMVIVTYERTGLDHMMKGRCLGHVTPYVGTILYLVNCTRLDITLRAITSLARFSAKPTKWHWNGVNHILWYLKGMKDVGLFHRVEEDSNIKGHVACMLPHLSTREFTKHVIFFLSQEQRYLGNQRSKVLQPHLQTVQKL